jgi:hypothetical protein
VSAIEVPDEVAARLAAEADRRGVTVEQLVTALAEGLPSAARAGGRDRRVGFVSLGSSTAGGRARDAEEMLAEGFGTS